MPATVECYGLIALIALILIVCDRYYPLLRDVTPPLGKQRAAARRSYSLARVQMAFWTSIILGALIFVAWHGNGAVDCDPNLVTLLGISGATGVAALAPDAIKDQQAAASTAAFAGTATTINSLNGQIGSILLNPALVTSPQIYRPLLTKLYALRNAQMAQLPGHIQVAARNHRSGKTTGFFSDLLTDENGNSLHRVQLVAFHLYFGLIVAHHAAAGDLKTALTSNALQLLGVSGGIYVGFKIPGK